MFPCHTIVLVTALLDTLLTRNVCTHRTMPDDIEDVEIFQHHISFYPHLVKKILTNFSGVSCSKSPGMTLYISGTINKRLT